MGVSFGGIRLGFVNIWVFWVRGIGSLELGMEGPPGDLEGGVRFIRCMN